METDYFFIASSKECLLNFHFFDRDENNKVYLNIKFDFGNSKQSLVCESLGFWLYINDVIKFRDALKEESFDLSLADVDGISLFHIKKNYEKIVVTHQSNEGNLETDSFSLQFNLTGRFVSELVKGLEGWIF